MREYRVDLALKKLRRKIWLQSVLNWLANGLLTAAGIVILFTAAAHLYPLPQVPGKALCLGAAVLAAALAAGMVKRPGLEQAAAAGDSTGMEERLTTYLEYRGKDSPLISVFREEVEYAVQKFDPVRRCVLQINGKKVLVAAVLLVLAWGLYFLPSEARRAAREKEEANRELKKEAGQINKLRHELASENPGRERNDEELLAVLEKLERKLNRTYDLNRAAAEVAAAQKELAQLAGKQENEIMQTLAGVFEGAGAGHRDLQAALRSGDMDKAMELSAERQFTEREQEAMLGSLKSLTAGALRPGERAELARLQTALENNSLTGEGLQEIFSSMDMGKKMQQVEESIAVKLQQSKERLLDRAESGVKSTGGKDYPAGFAQGEAVDYRHGEVSRTPGGELAAGGAGDSAVSRSDGVGGGGRTASGEGAGEGSAGEVGKQEQAARLGAGSGSLSQVQGQLGGKGFITDKIADQAPAEAGEFQPLASARASFRKEGLEYVLKHEIPLQRRELVMQYFTQLHGGN